MRLNKSKRFFRYFITNLIFLTLFSILISKAYSIEFANFFLLKPLNINWAPMFNKLPLLFYLLMISIVKTALSFFYSSINNKKKLNKIENALKMLNEGHYSAEIFLRMFSEDTPIQISKGIDEELLKLQEKMILISEEAISTTQQISAMTKESKEEIIELERKRIARELHDSVSQQLFAASMLLSTLQLENLESTVEIKQQINLVNSIVEEAQSELRALLLHLRPTKLEGKSLKEGIVNLLEELDSKVPVKINYDLDDVKLTEVVENNLFRITQELLSNVLRHAEAKELEIYFKKTEDFYRLRFVDDGKGFDIEQKKKSGSGLSNIKERIEGLGGNFQLVSFPKEGTSVEIRIPLIAGRSI